MGEIWIEGGKPLCGQVKVQGSKNAVLPMIAAAVLHEGEIRLDNCPELSDVYHMEKIVRSLGAKTRWEGSSLILDCSTILDSVIGKEDAESMRASVLFMGSLLSRTGSVKIAPPGGCVIGKRPIDLHLHILEAMGAAIESKDGIYHIHVSGRLKGVEYTFPFVSVGATENAILSAVRAKGISILKNCAMEPEILHLCELLQAMGAEIRGVGTRELWIRGVGIFRNARIRVPADRIVAGTWLYAAAATRGNVELEDAYVPEMRAVLEVYEKMGGQWDYNSGKLRADSRNIRNPISLVETDCYPGFPTDMQSILAAVLLTIPGESRIREKIFENRFRVMEEFARMGGKVKIQEKDACIQGGNPLTGTQVCAGDLRGGAALIVAALAAKGTTVIKNLQYIERGYEHLDFVLGRLGAEIAIR